MPWAMWERGQGSILPDTFAIGAIGNDNESAFWE